MFQIGQYSIQHPVVLAPMAGVTDRPFRQLCRRLGAGLVVSEMVTSDVKLWNSRKSQTRLDHTGEAEPISVQIAGGDPEMMAQAASMAVQHGAQIVDINMGCPAKKVCNKAAGSALMKDEVLVKDILQAVVESVDVPVTLKMRTGWAPEHKNAPVIATLAESLGIAGLAIHGRTRACGYKGEVEYDTIKQIKQMVSIPVLANGDIITPQQAKAVLDYTAADGVMLGRAAQGRPWIFREINHFLTTGEALAAPEASEVKDILLQHLDALYDFYGTYMGVRIARKHVGWYLQAHDHNRDVRRQFNQLVSPEEQVQLIHTFFNQHLGKEQAA
ncbi:tRNA dihydrouridine synthase DusB [Bermanella sp. R86510]|uniref:tRNA dihydrouridine synthase DusB n=1 Tax=unclassified Bermanella TaxID=2627862 RepID=UPI0037C9FCE5